jgi:hypothetical protein
MKTEDIIKKIILPNAWIMKNFPNYYRKPLLALDGTHMAQAALCQLVKSERTL